MAAPKRLKAIVTLAEECGWLYDETSDGHPRLRAPEGLIDPRTGRSVAAVTFSKTPSDGRADLNTIAQLRRLGVPIPHKGVTRAKRRS